MKPPLLLIGNFLGAVTGVRGVSEDLAAQLAGAGWPVITTSNKAGRVQRVSEMLLTIWHTRRSYDVAHVEVYSGPAFRWAEWACGLLQRLGKPFLLTLHGGNLPVFARKQSERVRRLFEMAAAVTTPSRYLLEQLKPYRADLRLLPNPLQLDAYAYHQRTQARPALVWLRAFHHIYNPQLAVRVAAQLREEFPDLQLTMIGPDKGDGSFQATRSLIEELRLADHITLPGAIAKADVPGWLQRGDIFLNTTNIDNTPISVLEALACGLCVVSTEVGGIPYLLQHERDALLVPPDDAAAMTAAVRRLLREPQLAACLSGQARQEAEQFDWARILPQWEALFYEAVQHTR